MSAKLKVICWDHLEMMLYITSTFFVMKNKMFTYAFKKSLKKKALLIKLRCMMFTVFKCTWNTQKFWWVLTKKIWNLFNKNECKDYYYSCKDNGQSASFVSQANVWLYYKVKIIMAMK